jgi:hypothetical protein
MIPTDKNQGTHRETCPNATLSTINLTWTTLGKKLGFCSEKPATNCLSYGMTPIDLHGIVLEQRNNFLFNIFVIWMEVTSSFYAWQVII